MKLPGFLRRMSSRDWSRVLAVLGMIPVVFLLVLIVLLLLAPGNWNEMAVPAPRALAFLISNI